MAPPEITVSAPSPARPASPASTLQEPPPDKRTKEHKGMATTDQTETARAPTPLSRASSHTLVDDTLQPCLSSLRKHLLLACFSAATFVDICNVTGVRVTVAEIGEALGLAPSQAVWVINTYSLCLAAFLLLAGRLADIFRPDWLFVGGLGTLGALTLAVSFVTDKIGFLVLRCLGGTAGAFVIPAAYRLTVGLFPDKTEQKRKLALLSISSALGGTLGTLLAGAVSYNWFFRIVAIICFISLTSTWLLTPSGEWMIRPDRPFSWTRVDIVGATLIIACLTCFSLALTEGPIRQWKHAVVIAPLALAPLLGIGFFGWERVLNDHRAMLPPSVWKIPTAVTSSLVILVPFPFWATSQVQYAIWWQANGKSSIMVAVAMLPQAVSSLACCVLVQFRPEVVANARVTIPIAGSCIIVAYILLIFSDGGLGLDYWRFCFPAFIIGSAGTMLTYFASVINFISNCPAEMAGVAGAWTQVATHVAGTICLAIQSAFSGEDSRDDWKLFGQHGFIFMIGWTALFCSQFFVPIVWRKWTGGEKHASGSPADGPVADDRKA